MGMHNASLPEEAARLPGLAEELATSSLACLAGEGLYPLDALAELVDPGRPLTILVRPAEEGRWTGALARRLARAAVEMGIPQASVRIFGGTAAELAAAGYRLDGDADAPRVFAASRDGSRADASESSDRASKEVGWRFDRAVGEGEPQLAVVARLACAPGSSPSLLPFVVDAALDALDERDRARARANPDAAARLLADGPLGRRVRLVMGDLIEVPVGPEPGSVWGAHAVLVGRDALSVESLGYAILASTRRARGLPPPPPHRVHAAAQGLDLSGSSVDRIDWRKDVV